MELKFLRDENNLRLLRNSAECLRVSEKLANFAMEAIAFTLSYTKNEVYNL